MLRKASYTPIKGYLEAIFGILMEFFSFALKIDVAKGVWDQP